MDMQVRVALIGFGGMGRIYAKMIHAGMIPELRLTGVCCRNASGQELLRKDFPDVCIYADTDDMAAHEADFDAVIIVTPHTSHIPIGLQMARLGKHILMDKPAGISAGEVEELVRYCDDHALTFSMIFHNRCLPAFAKAREMVRAGALGKLHRAVWVCNSWYRTPAYHRSAPWRSSWNGECGGLMITEKSGKYEDYRVVGDKTLYFEFTSTNHTGSYINMYVYGVEVDFKQSALYSKKQLKNTGVYKLMEEALLQAQNAN